MAAYLDFFPMQILGRSVRSMRESCGLSQEEFVKRVKETLPEGEATGLGTARELRHVERPSLDDRRGNPERHLLLLEALQRVLITAADEGKINRVELQCSQRMIEEFRKLIHIAKMAAGRPQEPVECPPPSSPLTPSPPHAPRWKWVGASVVLLAAALWALIPPNLWRLPTDEDLLTVCYPKEIQSHEISIFGECALKTSESRVVLFIRPEDEDVDGTRDFFIHPAFATPMPDGSWNMPRARFGNRQPDQNTGSFPLWFTFYVALFESLGPDQLPESPYTNTRKDEEFVQLLKDRGARSVAGPFRLIRRLETTCNAKPRIESPSDGSETASPVLFSWKPEEALYTELWTVSGVSVRPEIKNGDRFELAPGHYQFKVFDKKGTNCFASVWFKVTTPRER